MQTFIGRYIEQSEQRGAAAVRLRLLERRFSPQDESQRVHIAAAADTLLTRSERLPDARTLDDVLH